MDMMRIGAILCLALGTLIGQDGGRQDYSAALKELQTAAKAGQEDKVLQSMATMLAADPTRTAQDAIALVGGVEDLAAYYGILTSLGETWSKEGITAIAAAIRSEKTAKDLRRDLVIPIQLNEYTAADEVVVEIIKDTNLPTDIRIVMIEESAKRKIKDAIPALIDTLRAEEKKSPPKKDDPKKKGNGKAPELPAQVNEVARATRTALVTLTDKVLADADAYASWWETAKESFTVPGRKVDGQGATTKLAGSTIVRHQEMKKTLMKEEVVVIPDGNFTDNVRVVLDKLQVPYSVVKNEGRPQEKEIAKAKVLLVDCDGGMPFRWYLDSQNPTGLTDKASKMNAYVKKRVEDGMYLVTTDWGLKNVIVPTFGEVAKALKCSNAIVERATKEGWGSKRWRSWPAKGSGSAALFKDVWVETELSYGQKGPSGAESIRSRVEKRAMRMEWQFDVSCALIELPRDVKDLDVIAVSPEMGKQMGLSTIGFIYTCGKGKVLHLTAHFGEQADGKTDKFALQKLLLNFILEAQDR